MPGIDLVQRPGPAQPAGKPVELRTRRHPGDSASLDDNGLDALVTGVSFGTGAVLGEALRKSPAAVQSAWPTFASGILAGKQTVADTANGASFLFR